MITHIYRLYNYSCNGIALCGHEHRGEEEPTEPFVYINGSNRMLNDYEALAHHVNHEEYCVRCEELAPLTMLAATELE